MRATIFRRFDKSLKNWSFCFELNLIIELVTRMKTCSTFLIVLYNLHMEFSLIVCIVQRTRYTDWPWPKLLYLRGIRKKDSLSYSEFYFLVFIKDGKTLVLSFPLSLKVLILCRWKAVHTSSDFIKEKIFKSHKVYIQQQVVVASWSHIQPLKSPQSYPTKHTDEVFVVVKIPQWGKAKCFLAFGGMFYVNRTDALALEGGVKGRFIVVALTHKPCSIFFCICVTYLIPSLPLYMQISKFMLCTFVCLLLCHTIPDCQSKMQHI